MLRQRLRARFGKHFVLVLVLAYLVLPTLVATAQDMQNSPIQLQLDVSINGQSAKLIAAFTDLGGGRLEATGQELSEIGIKAPAGTGADQVVALDSIEGLTYTYDEPHQSINIKTSDKNRKKKSFSAREQEGDLAITPSSYGGVLNYTLFGAYGGKDYFSSYVNSDSGGVNANLDARLFSPYGVFSQTALLGMNLASETSALRLDTTYIYSDDDNLTQWSFGDFISGGTAWSRPVRMAGVQVRRSYAMRPDLVTNPLPMISGTAAVPSSVDVYINGVKSFTREVPDGPYQINDLPTISGGGVAQVVTRDSSGRETVQSMPFYQSPQLLKPGLLDFSAETGLARSNYGILSNDYDDMPFVSGTLRTGIADWLTIEGHGEATDKLLNGGAGFSARVYNRGVVSGAASGSLSDNGAGFQLYGSFETMIGDLRIHGRSQRAFDDYQDMASLSYRDGLRRTGAVPPSAYSAGGLSLFGPPRAIDSLTLSMPLSFDRGSISGTYLRYEEFDQSVTEIVSASYTRPLWNRANLNATGFVNFNDTSNSGFYLGISMSLDDNVSLGGGIRGDGDTVGASASISKGIANHPGSWGYRVTDNEGQYSYRSAMVGYRGSAALMQADIAQNGSGVRTAASLDGALVYMGGDVYAANRIDDSFAVVDAHTPDVKVRRDNQVIAVTDGSGKALVPNLISYEKNKVEIDPLDLPLNAEPDTTYNFIRPGFRSGVYVDFDVKLAPPSAIVILHLPNGKVVPVGSEARLEGSDDVVTVGYDGQAFVKGLQAVNTLHVSMESSSCTVHFAFKQESDAQPTIGPEVCQ
jgi:outer membrane usher protein